MKYLVRVKVPFGLHRKDDQLTVDLAFMEMFGKYIKLVAEIDEPEESSVKPPPRKQKKKADELVDVELPFVEASDGPSGDLHSEG